MSRIFFNPLVPPVIPQRENPPYETDVWTTAKLRLLDFLKEHRQATLRVISPNFSQAVEFAGDGTVGGGRF